MEVVAPRICFPTPTAFCGFRFLPSCGLLCIHRPTYYILFTLHFVLYVWTECAHRATSSQYISFHYIHGLWTQCVHCCATHYITTLNNATLHSKTYSSFEQLASRVISDQQITMCSAAKHIVYYMSPYCIVWGGAK